MDTLPNGSRKPEVSGVKIPIVRTSVLSGLLTGLAEVLALSLKQDWLLWEHPLSRDYYWMTPLADVLTFALVGAGLLLLRRLRPKWVTTSVVIFVCAFLGILSLFLLVNQIHAAALILLAAGIASQVARFFKGRPHLLTNIIETSSRWSRFVPFGRSPLPSMILEETHGKPKRSASGLQYFSAVIILLLVAGGAIHGLRYRNEVKLLNELPAARPNQPNILLLVLDTVRAKSMSLYGYERQTTPELERWAEKGVTFNRAMSTSSWTLPGHSSILTGLWRHETGVGWHKPLSAEHRTLAEALRSGGYRTGAFISNLIYCSRKFGLSQGFIHYEGFQVTIEQVIVSSSLLRRLTNSTFLRKLVGSYDAFNRKSAENINRAFIDWAAEDNARPFFAFLNYYDAHEPYLPPPPFDAMFGPSHVPGEFLFFTNSSERLHKHDLTLEEVQNEVNAYDSAIAYLDHQIGMLLDELDRRGILDNTIVVLTSDHGEEFLEHGEFDHGRNLFSPTVHVPLMIIYKASLEGAEIDRIVSVRDIPATILDLADLRTNPAFPGRSLVRAGHAEGQEPGNCDPIFLEVKNPDRHTWSVMQEPYKYIRAMEDNKSTEYLFNITKDPNEQHNLVDSLAHRNTLASLRALVVAKEPLLSVK